ncbi:glycosyltransferase family 4 protein, partial [candidate division KSB1 bacterium]|nr:glycosyltransferase family 4 protein [candidate division KSB1 bacterium]NIR68794.1 glycosyltransferase family 4 protein [candidate division KSB1 bacterium]NIS28126.1 glycosyltransferase family 4 protein [candidate division KSB1 bacterium]NIT75022.1 glycosyltransferase family 4 protein [candidate division KSB1 bacterium]NIU28806.1 glycosyltransferase family 4 protein [candidate division KSB1 bacterium]
PFAVPTGLKIVKRQSVDLLFSSAPPYTCHLIALALSWLTGIPWVADFRDPWTGFLSTPNRSGLSRWTDKSLEKKVYQSADALTVAWPGILNDLRSKYADVDSQKVRLLPNGYDFQDGTFYQPRFRIKDKFIITYSGSLYGKRDVSYFINALKELACKSEEFALRCLFRIVGRADPYIVESLEKNLSDQMYEIIPYVPHRIAVEYVLSSGVLLLVVDDSPLSKDIVPGKIYEYIGSGKEILALASENSQVATILRESRSGRAVNPLNTSKIMSELKQLYHRWQKGTLLNRPMNDASVQRYHRKYLTGGLSVLFDQNCIRKRIDTL